MTALESEVRGLFHWLGIDEMKSCTFGNSRPQSHCLIHQCGVLLAASSVVAVHQQTKVRSKLTLIKMEFASGS